MSLFREFDEIFNEMDRIHSQLWNDDWFTTSWNNNTRLIRDKHDQKQIQQQNKVDKSDNIEIKPKGEIKEEESKQPETQVAKTDDNNKGFLSSLWSGLDVNKSIQLKVDEQQDKYIVSANIPEFNKDQLTLQIRDGSLSISGEMKEEKKDEHSYSKSSKYVQRSFRLPNNIDEQHISAKYENGVLNVNIPKLDKPKQEKKDTIMIE